MPLSSRLLPQFAALAVVLLGACAPPASEPERVSLQLKWEHQAQFAGVYMAEARGLFAREGLNVELAAGGPGVDPLAALAAGRADFALVSPDELIVARRRGTPVVAIAAIFRRNPLVFLSRAEAPVLRPAELAGKRISFAGADGRLQLEALMRRHGLAPQSITVVPHDSDFAGLLAGRTDVSSAYLSAGLVRLAAAGHLIAVLSPEDFDVHFYGDVLATTDALLAARPQAVRALVRALAEGWREVLAAPEEAVRQVVSRASRTDPELQRTMLARSFALVHTGRDRIGWMRLEEWAAMEQSLIDSGLVSAPPAPASYFSMLAFEPEP